MNSYFKIRDVSLAFIFNGSYNGNIIYQAYFSPWGRVRRLKFDKNCFCLPLES